MPNVLNLTGKEQGDTLQLEESELNVVSITNTMKFGTKDGIDVIKPVSSKLHTNEAGQEFLDSVAEDKNEQSNLLVNLHVSNAITSIMIASEKMVEDNWNAEEQASILSKLITVLVEMPAMKAMDDVINKEESKKH